MKCRVCGSHMRAVVRNLPFKVNEVSIIILKDLPAFQCERCSEYLLEDRVMNCVDEFLGRVDSAAELEVIKYAA